MVVNLGMTANAAAAHEHEYSPHSDRPPGRSTPRPSFLSLPLRYLTTGKREKPASASQGTDTPAVSSPSQTSSPLYSPRESIDGESNHEDTKDPQTDEARPVTPQKQPSRPKTSFRFAHPPPSTRPRRLRIRPKLLLQLQQVSLTSRPVPALDVIPSTFFGPLSVSRRFSNAVLAKDQRPSPTDLIVVPSDRYEPTAVADDEGSVPCEDEHSEQRKAMATLRHNRKDDAVIKGSVEIHMNNGSFCWKVGSLPQGGYEFSRTDEHGVQQCVRWVMRAKGNRQNTNSTPGANDETNKRFIFSIIDPRTRRHPVIGWMSRRGIDILDQYSLSATPTTQNRNVSGTSSAGAQVDQTTDSAGQTVVETDENLRMLIVTTGMWTAFREGWSQNPLSADGASLSPSVHSPTPLSPQLGASNVRTAVESKPAEKATYRGNLHEVGTRLLGGGTSVLQRTGSSTAESWTSAGRANGQDEDINHQPETEQSPKRSAKQRTAADHRRNRASIPFREEGQKNVGDSRLRPSRSLQQLSAVDGAANDPAHLEDENKAQNGTEHGRANDNLNMNGTKLPKKKWRRFSNWLDIMGKKKPH